MKTYYLISLDDDFKPIHTMKMVSRDDVTADSLPDYYKAGCAKLVVARDIEDARAEDIILDGNLIMQKEGDKIRISVKYQPPADVQAALDSMPETEWNEDNEEFEVVTDDAALWYIMHSDTIKRALAQQQQENVACGDVSKGDAIVSDADIDAAWGNANFGQNTNKREIIIDTMFKYAQGYSTGSTATNICQELGLIKNYRTGKDVVWTEKGEKYIRALAQQQPVNVWQPIETAPRDGV